MAWLPIPEEPLPEPIDVVEHLLLQRGYSPQGIVALCERVAAATGNERGPCWSPQLQEVGRLALAVETYLEQHKDP